MLIHVCRRCGFQGKIYVEWVDHLWKQEHQKVSRSSFLKWSDEDNLKSLVVYVSTSPFPLPSQVMALFLEQAIGVVDFVCWADRPQNFVVQFENTDDVDKVLKIMREQPTELSFSGKPLGLRRKSDIADFEWPCLIGDGMTRNGSSENPVLIELSDDSNSSDSDVNSNEAATNGNHNSSNGSDQANQMETDDTRSVPVQNGHTGVDNENGDAAEDEEIEDVDIVTKMSNEFQRQFLESTKSKEQKDDKSTITKNLQRLQEQWLEVYVGFHNIMWPLCFVMKNKGIKTNKNEVGFEAKFTCECVPSQHNKWINKSYKKDRVDEKIEEFSRLMADEQKCAEMLTKIDESTNYEKAPHIKFKCHFVVTFTVSGNATAEMKWKNISGTKAERKIKSFQRVFKRLFSTYEALKLKEWLQHKNVEKQTIKKEKGKRKWTELEVITVE